MDQKAERLERGRWIYLTQQPYTGINNRRYAEDSAMERASYLLAEERFITNHDDTAVFVEIIDRDEQVIRSWMFDCPMIKRFSAPDYYDDDCLILYLMEIYGLPLVGDRARDGA